MLQVADLKSRLFVPSPTLLNQKSRSPQTDVQATDSGIPQMSTSVRLTVAVRDGVVSGLVQVV